ncbi:MAG: hypothetical protein ACO326_05855 [Burkholderiaceae bacterium]|jgi:hypothetical protein
MRLLLSLFVSLGLTTVIGCSQNLPDCPDPVAASDEPMTEQEKKLARLKTGFDPSCKSN